MSRCFPFPPPGYEKKSWTESIDLLTKEKHKEKKHKKEKKDKEKREHKEKKDKDRSKDKHKEKKDRKEKHKDRRRDKEKGRILEDRIDGRNELHTQESLPKAEEEKDSKLMEELGRRTRDDGAANRMVGSFTNSSIQRKVEGMGTVALTSQKERFADNRAFSIEIGSQKRNGVNDFPIENISSSLSRTWTSSIVTSMEKERGKTHGNIVFGSATAQTGSRGISRPMESVFGLVNRKSAGSTAELDKGNFGQKETVPNPFTPGLDKGKIVSTFTSSCLPTQKRDEVLGLSAENVSSIRSKTVGTSGLPPMEKGRIQGYENFPLPYNSSEQRKNSAISQPLQKDGYPKVERKVNDSKGPKVGDHIEKKTKAKDNDGHHKDKKKEEKIVKKVEEVEYNKFINLGPKDGACNLNSKPMAPHKDNKPGIFAADGTTKKRKDLQTNGFLHENDARPEKSPRMITSSPQPLSNGTKLDLHLAAQSKLSSKVAPINNSKPDATLHNNGDIKPPTSGTLVENGEVSSKAPHPDAKHLSKVYTVPNMAPWPEFDEQDWLFKRAASWQKPEAPREDELAPQVWARGMMIDSVDVFALPYVAPF